jgi:type VI secretion system protein ImpH
MMDAMMDPAPTRAASSEAAISADIATDIATAIATAIATLGPAPAFAKAVRALEAALAGTGRTLRPIGTTGAPSEEGVLFRATPSLAFAPSDIAAIRPGTGTWPVEMEVAFLGLYGPASPLPTAWTELIVMDMPGADNIRDALDLFDHPLIALSWRIMRSGRIEWLWDDRGGDPASVAILALAGIVPGTSSRLDRVRLLPLAGLLAQYSRGAGTVAAVVGHYFGIPARVVEWVASRAVIPTDQQFRLGEPGATAGNMCLGETVPDVSGVVRLVLGPLPLDVFVTFLPGGAQREALRSLLRLAVREPVRIEVDLMLEPDGAAGMVLGDTSLGWTSWAAGPGAAAHTATGWL